MINKLHHNAYRCRNSEETRRFYEDFLGLTLAATRTLTETKTGRTTVALHTFYRLGDASYLAFFEVPDAHFDFKRQHDFDLHIALEVDRPTLRVLLRRSAEYGLATRGIIDHEFVESIYIRDPNGYVIELCAKQPDHDVEMDPNRNAAREKLDQWTAATATSRPV